MSEEELNDKEMKDVNGGTDEIKKKIVKYPPNLGLYNEVKGPIFESVALYAVRYPPLSFNQGEKLIPGVKKKVVMKKTKENEEKE